MAFNEKKITLEVGADDALLVQGHLRLAMHTFQEAGNVTMVGVLMRFEEAFEKARAKAAPA